MLPLIILKCRTTKLEWHGRWEAPKTCIFDRTKTNAFWKKWPHGRQKAAPPCDIKQTPLRLSKKWLWLALVFSNNCASEQDKQEIYIKQIFQHNMTLYSVVARWQTCWDLIDVIWLYCVSRREFFFGHIAQALIPCADSSLRYFTACPPPLWLWLTVTWKLNLSQIPVSNMPFVPA